MTDHELLHPGSEPLHRQHLAADEDIDFICPGELLPKLQKRLTCVKLLPGIASVSGQMLSPVRQCILEMFLVLANPTHSTVCIMM